MALGFTLARVIRIATLSPVMIPGAGTAIGTLTAMGGVEFIRSTRSLRSVAVGACLTIVPCDRSGSHRSRHGVSP